MGHLKTYHYIAFYFAFYISPSPLPKAPITHLLVQTPLQNWHKVFINRHTKSTLSPEINHLMNYIYVNSYETTCCFHNSSHGVVTWPDYGAIKPWDWREVWNLGEENLRLEAGKMCGIWQTYCNIKHDLCNKHGWWCFLHQCTNNNSYF